MRVPVQPTRQRNWRGVVAHFLLYAGGPLDGYSRVGGGRTGGGRGPRPDAACIEPRRRRATHHRSARPYCACWLHTILTCLTSCPCALVRQLIGYPAALPQCQEAPHRDRPFRPAAAAAAAAAAACSGEGLRAAQTCVGRLTAQRYARAATLLHVAT